MPSTFPKPGFITRIALRFASTRLGGWVFTTLLPPLDRRLLKLSHGRLSLAGLGEPTLLLTTIGAKSGLRRSTPLLFLQHDQDIVVVGSRGGRAQHAAWYYNVRANPQVWITLHGQTRPFTAHETTGDERTELWQKFLSFNPGFARYAQRLERHIPVMKLVPSPGRDDGEA